MIPPDTQATEQKRRRGGQPGNKNAKGNRGNPSPLKNISTRKGGAPLRNQNARKKHTLQSELTRDYGKYAEAQAWIDKNANVLDAIVIPGEQERDAALFDWSQGFTLEKIATKGKELKLGLYIRPEGLASGESR